MNLRKCFASLLICNLWLSALFAGRIEITYPWDGKKIPAVKKTFVLGNIQPSTATLYINGEKIDVYKTGSFIAQVPVAPGDFAFNCELFDGDATNYYSREIKVAAPLLAAVSTSTLNLKIISPASDEILKEGDLLNVLAIGTPGKKAEFTLKGLVKHYPMTEMPRNSGRYYAAYFIRGGKRVKKKKLEIKLFGGAFPGKISVKSDARISVDNVPWLVVTSTDNAVIRNGVNGGYMMFLCEGVKLVADGKIGPMIRVRLAENFSGWIHESKVEKLPAAALWPDAETRTISISTTSRGIIAKVSMWGKMPYMVLEKGREISVRLFYTRVHSNWVIYNSQDNFLKAVSFETPATNVAQVNLTTKEKIWGYDVYYRNNALFIEVRKEPKIAGKWPKPLKNLRVVLDPGHSMLVGGRPMKENPPYDGAISPSGWTECEANLEIARQIEKDLLKLGATVYMTRKGGEEVPLKERPKIAKKAGGDIYISIHNNAIADGRDPFAAPRGFSIYFYHAHSMAFAKSIHDSFVRSINLPDEGLRFGDYHVVRMTYMPSILVENAYMIFPEHEEMLKSARFRAKLSKAVCKGILDFFEVPKKKRRVRRRRRKR